MIISASTRTDIPAFYSDWLYKRIEEGFVYVRNPYNMHQVTKYLLTPDVVDAIVLWTKNPIPMVDRMEEIQAFHPYFFVTVTPYGKEVEPGVPPKELVLQAMCTLSNRLGKDSVALRYDPIFVDDKYTVEYHTESFRNMMFQLEGVITDCVISFVDLYEKTKRNFKELKTVTMDQVEEIASEFSKIAKEHGIRIKTCAEAVDLSKYGIFNSGCISREMMERHLKTTIKAKPHSPNRSNCTCIESKDIGVYNTCLHGCRYCYANYNEKMVRANMLQHKKDSPFLIGGPRLNDIVTVAKQESIVDGQIRFDFLS